MKAFKKIVICGVGLIGGSFALALRRGALAEQIVGMGRSRETLERAMALGIIDEAPESWPQALEGASLVLIACPVAQTGAVLEQIAPHLAPTTIVTDAGSTKGDVVEAIYRHLPHHLTHVIPGHPIAGTEHSGPDAAHAHLFDGRRVVLTPLPENSTASARLVSDLWSACGASVVEMHPQDHDRIFAAVSHLPHLLAYGLVHDIAKRANAEQLFAFAAGGFRDFTRIAGSHPEMWRDICITNRQPLLAELDQYLSELAYLRSLLLAGKSDLLSQHFATAREARNNWIAQIEQSEQAQPAAAGEGEA